MAIITKEQLREWVLKDGADQVEETAYELVTAAVNAAVVDFCGRSFDTVTVSNAAARVYRPGRGRLVRVDDFWTNGGLVVKTDTSDDGTFDTTWATNQYQLRPHNQLNAGQAWPYTSIEAVDGATFPTGHRRPSVQITAAWGWSAVPAAVTQGALIFGGRLAKRRDSPDGISGFNQFGPVRITARTDPDVVAMLAFYVRVHGKAMVA